MAFQSSNGQAKTKQSKILLLKAYRWADFGIAITWMKDKCMHFEILDEDVSGKIVLDTLVPKIIGNEHTYRTHFYKGIGHIPKGLKSSDDPQKRILLDQLPKLVRGYGHTLVAYPRESQAILIVVCDLDRRCQKEFRRELLDLLTTCNPKPRTYFCLAIEEGEAWFLGDLRAVRKAYPHAREGVLASYTNDDICDTWEKLADAIVSGGAKSLEKQGWQAIGKEKSIWAEKIAPHMDINNNLSPSFCYFRDKLQSLTHEP